MYMYVYIYICVCVCMYMCVCVCVCVCIYIYINKPRNFCTLFLIYISIYHTHLRIGILLRM